MRHDNLKLEMLDGSRPGEKIMVLDGVLTADTAFHFRDSVRAQQALTAITTDKASVYKSSPPGRKTDCSDGDC